MGLTRRETLVTALALSACAPTTARSGPSPDDPRIAAIETRIGGRVGVCAIDTATGAMIVHRVHERFAMCSSFKWLLAAQHLHMDQETPGWLGEILLFGRRDLIPHSPVASQHLARGYMSNLEMCEGMVVTSDNTCANLLLVPAGGPEGHTRFLRAHGDAVTRLDRNEMALNQNLPGDPRDTSTPHAMVHTLRRIALTDEVLKQPAREQLIGWMSAARTGLDRLRGGFPAGWRAADKTGTSDDVNNATVDVAIGWPPRRPPIVVAAFLSDSTVDLPARKAAHAQIGRIVGETWD